MESPLPILVAAVAAEDFDLPLAIALGRPWPNGGWAGWTLVPEIFAGSILAAVRPLGCLIRLNVLPWVKKMEGCMFFPPRC